MRAYAERGWRPVVAPELEFFLTKINEDPDYPLEPPIGRSRRPESARQSYGIEAVNEFDPIFEDVYDWCEAQEIDIDTLTHESGAAQMEINFNHGDPLELADQAFLFKRTLRQAALKHGIYATFMAKPMEREPGSAMHIHQSVFDIATGANLFAAGEDGFTELFLQHIAGLQKYLPAAMPLLAPERQLLPPPAALLGRPDQPALGLGEPHRRPARAGLRPAARAGSRTGSPAPTPTPIWRSRPRSPAACSA